MDKYLTAVKFPWEFSHNQRSLLLKCFFKANEYKNFIFYSSIVLKKFLSKKYFNHLFHYILFIRILCQDEIDESDILLSFKLIYSFIKNYENLYGRENMTFNLHGHIHLPFQASKFGPINKISSFPFEGMFKNFRRFFHGTKNYASQIYRNLALENLLYFNQYENVEKLRSGPLKAFTKSLFKRDYENKTNEFDGKFVQKDLNLSCSYDSYVKQFFKIQDKTILCSNFLKTKIGSKDLKKKTKNLFTNKFLKH